MALGALGGQSSGLEQLEVGRVLVCDIQGSHTVLWCEGAPGHACCLSGRQHGPCQHCRTAGKGNGRQEEQTSSAIHSPAGALVAQIMTQLD